MIRWKKAERNGGQIERCERRISTIPGIVREK